MKAYVFREEERPRFGLGRASLVALILLLLFGLLGQKARVFSLSPEQLAQLEQQRQELARDLKFRFIDAPEDQVKNPNAEVFSDADRIKKSQADAPNQDPDPVSEGNTFELKAGNPNRQESPTQAMQAPSVPPQPVVASVPTPPVKATPEQQQSKLEDQAEKREAEEAKLARDEPEPVEKESVQPLFKDGPKPFRKLTEQERAEAKEHAVAEMTKMSAVPQPAAAPVAAGGSRYHNPQGSAAPQLGFSIDTAGHDLGPYLNILLQKIRGNWRIPQIARYEVAGFTVVSFKLHQDGSITEAMVLKGSTYEPLDASSMNAITNSHPAPPLPAHIEEPWIPIKIGFFYNMRPPR